MHFFYTKTRLFFLFSSFLPLFFTFLCFLLKKTPFFSVLNSPLSRPKIVPNAQVFNSKLRDEILNREVFYSAKEAEVIVEDWRLDYNNHRPHSSLGYMTPAAYAASCNLPGSAVLRLANCRVQNVDNSPIVCGT